MVQNRCRGLGVHSIGEELIIEIVNIIYSRICDLEDLVCKQRLIAVLPFVVFEARISPFHERTNRTLHRTLCALHTFNIKFLGYVVL